MTKQRIRRIEVSAEVDEAERFLFDPNYISESKPRTGLYSIDGDEVTPEVEGQYNPTNEPRYTWPEIVAKRKKHGGKHLVLYVEAWPPEEGPLPILGPNPPDWAAIDVELDKGWDQDLYPIIDAYLNQGKPGKRNKRGGE